MMTPKEKLMIHVEIEKENREHEEAWKRGKKIVKDGWHTVSGRSVYVDGGYIVRGMKGKGFDRVAAHVYRWSDRWQVWTSEERVTVDAFRAGVRRGTIALM